MFSKNDNKTFYGCRLEKAEVMKSFHTLQALAAHKNNGFY